MISETITGTKFDTESKLLDQYSDTQIQAYLTTYNTTGSGYSGNMTISSDGMTMTLHRSFDTLADWVTYRNVLGTIWRKLIETEDNISYSIGYDGITSNITVYETFSLLGNAINDGTSANVIINNTTHDSFTSNSDSVVLTSFFPSYFSNHEFADRTRENIMSITRVLPANNFSYSHTISAN